jgi:hypothetical protein
VSIIASILGVGSAWIVSNYKIEAIIDTPKIKKSELKT